MHLLASNCVFLTVVRKYAPLPTTNFGLPFERNAFAPISTNSSNLNLRCLNFEAMDLRRLLGQMNMGGAGAGPAGDTPMVDTAETVHVSSLALLKMLKHGMFLTPPKPARIIFFHRAALWWIQCASVTMVPLEIVFELRFYIAGSVAAPIPKRRCLGQISFSAFDAFLRGVLSRLNFSTPSKFL